jgi:hypothetical protein
MSTVKIDIFVNGQHVLTEVKAESLSLAQTVRDAVTKHYNLTAFHTITTGLVNTSITQAEAVDLAKKNGQSVKMMAIFSQPASFTTSTLPVVAAATATSKAATFTTSTLPVVAAATATSKDSLKQHSSLSSSSSSSSSSKVQIVDLSESTFVKFTNPSQGKKKVKVEHEQYDENLDESSFSSSSATNNADDEVAESKQLHHKRRRVQLSAATATTPSVDKAHEERFAKEAKKQHRKDMEQALFAAVAGSEEADFEDENEIEEEVENEEEKDASKSSSSSKPSSSSSSSKKIVKQKALLASLHVQQLSSHSPASLEQIVSSVKNATNVFNRPLQQIHLQYLENKAPGAIRTQLIGLCNLALNHLLISMNNFSTSSTPILAIVFGTGNGEDVDILLTVATKKKINVIVTGTDLAAYTDNYNRQVVCVTETNGTPGIEKGSIGLYLSRNSIYSLATAIGLFRDFIISSRVGGVLAVCVTTRQFPYLATAAFVAVKQGLISAVYMSDEAKSIAEGSEQEVTIVFIRTKEEGMLALGDSFLDILCGKSSSMEVDGVDNSAEKQVEKAYRLGFEILKDNHEAGSTTDHPRSSETFFCVVGAGRFISEIARKVFTKGDQKEIKSVEQQANTNNVSLTIQLVTNCIVPGLTEIAIGMHETLKASVDKASSPEAKKAALSTAVTVEDINRLKVDGEENTTGGFYAVWKNGSGSGSAIQKGRGLGAKLGTAVSGHGGIESRAKQQSSIFAFLTRPDSLPGIFSGYGFYSLWFQEYLEAVFTVLFFGSIVRTPGSSMYSSPMRGMNTISGYCAISVAAHAYAVENGVPYYVAMKAVMPNKGKMDINAYALSSEASAYARKNGVPFHVAMKVVLPKGSKMLLSATVVISFAAALARESNISLREAVERVAPGTKMTSSASVVISFAAALARESNISLREAVERVAPGTKMTSNATVVISFAAALARESNISLREAVEKVAPGTKMTSNATVVISFAAALARESNISLREAVEKVAPGTKMTSNATVIQSMESEEMYLRLEEIFKLFACTQTADGVMHEIWTNISEGAHKLYNDTTTRFVQASNFKKLEDHHYGRVGGLDKIKIGKSIVRLVLKDVVIPPPVAVTSAGLPVITYNDKRCFYADGTIVDFGDIQSDPLPEQFGTHGIKDMNAPRGKPTGHSEMVYLTFIRMSNIYRLAHGLPPIDEVNTEKVFLIYRKGSPTVMTHGRQNLQTVLRNLGVDKPTQRWAPIIANRMVCIGDIVVFTSADKLNKLR